MAEPPTEPGLHEKQARRFLGALGLVEHLLPFKAALHPQGPSPFAGTRAGPARAEPTDLAPLGALAGEPAGDQSTPERQSAERSP